MFRTPILQELYARTLAAEFDMCNLGELQDPVSGKLIKKAMTIMTTSKILQKALHGHHCRKDHEHQTIEGTTKYGGVSISRSTFTENYPRKFARYVARVILKRSIPDEKPYAWEECEALVSSQTRNAPKRRRLSCVPAVRSPSIKHPREAEEGDNTRPKKFRLSTKSHPSVSVGENSDAWKQILDELSPTLPRVGRAEIQDPQIIQKIQDLVGHQNEIKTIVGGKGMNRTTAPLRKFEIGEAPWRKLVYIHRKTGKVHGADSWEKWEDLPKRKIVRTGYPSSVYSQVIPKTFQLWNS